MTTVVPTDEQIQQEVLAELRFDPRLQPHDIGVSVHDGVVALAGLVDSVYKKWAAEEAVLRVRGVRAVANEIGVRLPTSTEETDADIAAAAAWALEWDVSVPSDVSATVSDGWVTLRGEVGWGFQREEAERVVRRLKGVRGVTNLIRVQPQPLPAPEMCQFIERALQRSATLDASRITVEAEVDGKVRLSGTVRTAAERREAEQVAWSAAGVTEVENRLTVSGQER